MYWITKYPIIYKYSSLNYLCGGRILFIKYYDKDGNKINLGEYAELLTDNEYKIIKQEPIGEYFVSTVWLGIDLGYGMGRPIIFETMVFNSKTDLTEQYQDRYSTQEEALKGHEEAVQFVMNSLSE